MKNAFLIVNYNDYNTTLELLNKIKNYKIIDRIIVVDNMSPDDSYKNLKAIKNIANLEVIRTKENKGYGYAINEGVKYLLKEGDYRVVLSNADIIINSNKDLEKLYQRLDDDEIGIVAPTIIEKNNLNRGWKIPTPLQDVVRNIPVIYKQLEKKSLYNDDYYKDEESIVEVVSGSFFLMKASTLKKINYNDENIFLYYEENILASKIASNNLKAVVLNNIKVIHNHSVTIDKNIKKIGKFKILKKSQRYFHKTYNNANFFEIILLYISYLLALVIYSISYTIIDFFKN